MNSLLTKLRYLLERRQQKYAVLLLFLMIGGAAFEALGVGLVLPFIATLQDPQFIYQQKLLHFVHSVMGRSNRFYLVGMSGLLLFAFVLKNLYLARLYFFQFRLVASMQIALTHRLYTTYLFSPYTFHLQRNSAGLLNNVYSEINMLFFNVLVPSLVVLSEGLVVVVLTALLVFVDPLTSVVSLVWIGSSSAIFYYSIRKKMRRLGNERQGYQEQMIRWINQGLGSIKETRVLGREPFFIDAFTKNMSAYANATRFLQTFNNVPRLFIEVLAVTLFVVIVVLTLGRGDPLAALTPKLALFGMAAFRMMPSMNRIVTMATQILYHKAAIDVVFKDLKSLESVRDTDPPATLSAAAPLAPLAFQRAIEFNNISYQYPSATFRSLKDITLTVPKGAVIGLVGPSGAGKTTFVDLLLGLLTPIEGNVLVDGQNIHNGLMPSWQRNIGYIPQNIYLMDDSVRKNIAFGLPDDRIDEEKIWHALRKAQLEQVVRNLPDGLDTSVGERGVRLSGGEKQRLGIARALYHDPELLVMDEATSALDYETEEQVVLAIDALRGEKTLVVIAHRLSTVRNCDTIYQLADGELKGVVRYEDLVSHQIGVISKSGT